MKAFGHRIVLKLGAISRYRIKLMVMTALFWTIIDTGVYLYKFFRDHINEAIDPFDMHTSAVLLLRTGLVFIICLAMAYLLIYQLKHLVRNLPLGLGLLIKSILLVGAAFLLNYILHYTYIWLIEKEPLTTELGHNYYKTFQSSLFFSQWIRWLITFLVTILIIEVNEKYSPGVFLDILAGRYLTPKNEKRTVIFIDLVDSTTIAEQLGHKKYFRFIRDFIYFISIALLENDGQIYQYVGDEVVASWVVKNSNANKKCLQALLDCKRLLKRNNKYFKRQYGFVPEFRAGIHTGEVTIGEIGVIKKDLAMSGDTMNTAARLRSATSELNQQVITSKAFVSQTNLKNWQFANLGLVDLKGKESAMELYALKF
ncbi:MULTISPECIES: adenylate/guanylate cyclase domain-containing protein [Niastella]|uniref:Adenylate/guanylate cyclase domain-containing protein n=1 Tax=Niastella soli TaxID=2821487 RepID=A0ABS3YQF4_9BACT|nr:adenylate/guanylate cyclase domain-containing protein [Niastella soli]MBO9200038.1 adenylate/guanylate cyclase domain-containing protein [Niastella soli]